jgi:tetratricopeptide (TPR) repeat protein
MNGLGLSSRATAILELLLPGERQDEALPLDVEREYLGRVRIRGKDCGGASFCSPMGDEKWRQVIDAIRGSTTGDGNRTRYNRIFDAGRQLYEAIAAASPDLRRFLEEAGTPRRLVIASDRPEIHRLPWEAMIDSRNQHVAESDLSVVHADRDTFDTVPYVASDTLRLVSHFGPGTEASTRDALRQLSTAGTQGEQRGLSSTPLDAEDASQLREHVQKMDPDIIHIEAHGDHLSGTIQLTADLNADPSQLADLFGERLMVLFWSCYSSMVQPWGESPGRMLQRKGTKLVLGFATPLRYEAANTLATKFYLSVFDPRSGGDVESVVTREQARLFQKKEDRYECVWASLTVWLRCPLDVSPSVKDGPRTPREAWTDQSLDVERALAARIRGAVAGRLEVIEGVHVPERLPSELVTGFPGAVVHLRGSPPGPFDDLLSNLTDEHPESPHPADTLLTLLSALSHYRSSLLLWSDISEREVRLFQLLEDLPANVAVLLAKSGQTRTPDRTLEGLETLVDRGHFREALKLWDALGDHAMIWKGKEPGSYLRYQRAGYWTHVKLRKNDTAEACIHALEEASKAFETGDRASESYAFAFESRLLRANLRQRRAHLDLARTLYYEARELAREKKNDRDLGLASLELAYLSAEVGDRVLAEALYRESVDALGRAHGQSRDIVWRSALGRVLRDYADLIATEPGRSEEARRLLRRSIAIHALDGRDDQLAAVLRTRGRLAATEGDGEAAEASLEASAAICNATGNSAGWMATMREMASLALSSGRYDQCRNILMQLIGFLEQEPRDREIGLVAAQLARVSWRMGLVDEVVRWCERAEQLLPSEMDRERKEIRNLGESARSLGGKKHRSRARPSD